MKFRTLSLSLLPDIRHPEELSLLRKPRDPKKKKKKLEEVEEDDLEMEGPLLTPGSGQLVSRKCIGCHCTGTGNLPPLPTNLAGNRWQLTEMEKM